MDAELALIGIAKIGFGVVVSGIGVLLASRLLKGALGLRGLLGGEDPAAGAAAGVVWAGSVLALAILVRSSVESAFSAMDFVSRSTGPWLETLARFAFYAVVHVAVSLAIGAGALGLGLWLFLKMTADIDELELIRSGRLGPAVVLAAVMALVALLTAPGLETLLAGLIPLPSFPAGVIVPPA